MFIRFIIWAVRTLREGKMKKVKVYRGIGWILVSFGTIGYLVFLARTYRFDMLIKSSAIAVVCVLITNLFLFAMNIFLWIGLILQWRADRNESPDKKSKWGRFIKIYLIFAIIMFLCMASLIIVGQLFPGVFEGELGKVN
jgi:hypothetical protein